MVLRNVVLFGTVNAGKRHWEQAAVALAAADTSWLSALITRRVPLDRWTEALDRQPDDIKVVVDLTA
jgi:glucose 1-dehydrogenase